MSYTLHGCTKFEVQYTQGYFSRKYDEVQQILSEYFIEYDTESDFNTVDRKLFKDFLEDIQNNEEMVTTIKHIFAGDKGYKDFVENMQEIYSQSDASNSFIPLVWY